VDKDETRAFAQRLMGDSNRAHPGAAHMGCAFTFGALREIGFDGYLAMECAVRGDAETVTAAGHAAPAVFDDLRSVLGDRA
jgi:hypothetical protein